jgi:hypothetical protein
VDQEKSMSMDQEEARRDRDLAAAFVAAVHRGDVAAFNEAAHRLSDEAVAGWTLAFRSLARRPPRASRAIRAAFFAVWTEGKSLRLRVGEDRTTITVLRLLLPRYKGPPLRLFRGASARSRRTRRYGLSWTEDFEVADRFALQKQTRPGGSVVLETVAQPRAIICAIEYPEPLTIEEVRRTYPNFPNVKLGPQFHEEDEYLVDRRALTKVDVVRRYG